VDYVANKLNEKVSVEIVNSLVRIWSLGLVKDSQLLHSLHQKHNTSQLLVVVHNYSRWNIR